MRNFWSTFFASLLAVIAGGIVITIISCFFFMISVTTMISAIGSSDIKPISDKSILKIELTKINELESNYPLNVFFPEDNKTKSVSLSKLIESIERASDDKRIDGIYLTSGSVSSGIASLHELRKALEEFKKSGKWIISYADIYSQGGYYLSSIADHVYMNPVGMLQLEGISSQSLFYKDALKKIGVKMMIFKVGTYKGAVEPFMLDSFSNANREQMRSFMSGLWEEVSQSISKSRSISLSKLNEITTANTISFTSNDLQKQKLIDGVLYQRQVLQELCKKVGTDEIEDLKFVSPYDLSYRKKTNSSKSKNKIAVYIAEGSIAPKTSSFSSKNNIDENVAPQLIKIANNNDIKALVLRVNSPGGSAFISDQIWDAICYIKSKKPVVVSMGDYAASGGYYISSAANYIFAEPVTITGSIGIFGMFPNLKGTADKLALKTDEVKTHENTGLFSNQFRSLSEYEKETMQKNIERGYDIFLSRVSEGRKMNKSMVDSVGQGRVWTGKQALERNLVDELGGMDEAIVKAAELAKISNYKVVYTNRSKGLSESILKTLMGGVSYRILNEFLTDDEIQTIEEIKTLRREKELQAIFPYRINF